MTFFMFFLMFAIAFLLAAYFTTKQHFVSAAIMGIAAILLFTMLSDLKNTEDSQLEQKRKQEILRLCDATQSGWYWRNGSQVACPVEWEKKQP